MPRTIMLSNALLLVCLSALAGSGMMMLHAGSGEVLLDARVITWFNTAALVTSIVMVVTEWFSGLRWVAVVAVGAVVVASFLRVDAPAVPSGAVYAWLVAWVAVAVWFGYLAGLGRHSD